MALDTNKFIKKAANVFVSQSIKDMNTAILECETAGLYEEAKIISNYRRNLQAILSGEQAQTSLSNQTVTSVDHHQPKVRANRSL